MVIVNTSPNPITLPSPMFVINWIENTKKLINNLTDHAIVQKSFHHISWRKENLVLAKSRFHLQHYKISHNLYHYVDLIQLYWQDVMKSIWYMDMEQVLVTRNKNVRCELPFQYLKYHSPLVFSKQNFLIFLNPRLALSINYWLYTLLDFVHQKTSL